MNIDTEFTSDEINVFRKELERTLKKYKGKEHIKLDMPVNVLEQIIFKDFYKKIDGAIPKVPAIDFNLIKKLDLTGVSFDGTYLSFEDFTGSHGVVINPQTVWNKELNEVNLRDVTFNGSFDGCSITGTHFQGSHGAVINPQTIKNKDLSKTVLSGVEFTGSFDEVNISFANFKGSCGAVIDPRKLYLRDLVGTVLADVEFVSPHGDKMFNNCKIDGANFKGSRGAIIIPCLLVNRDLRRTVLSGVTFKLSSLPNESDMFEDCCIDEANFRGSIGAIINPQTVWARRFSKTVLTDALVVGSFENCFIDKTVLDGVKGINPLELEQIKQKEIPFFGTPIIERKQAVLREEAKETIKCIKKVLTK